MPLAAGTRLGPYEIEAPLGAGGMGEVYRARDTRLDRTVAIKVLPSHLSGSSHLRQRFELEARAISRLNHPHICTLHDVELEGEQGFLVMEHLEGESLAARLSRGVLPLEEALQRAGEILDALDAAHRAGIVHRDLKPGNVMLTASGAKVLDFGLSRHHGHVKGTPDQELGRTATSDARTAAPTLTAEGTIVGTPPYMAPEQVQGRAVDTRADLFAFGALFFEMLTGQRAFKGNNAMAVVAAVLERDPPAPSSLRPGLPVALDAIVCRCFAKDPEARWQSARDLRYAIMTVPRTARDGSSDAESGDVTGSATFPRWRERAVWAILVAGLAITIIGLVAVMRRPTAAPGHAIQLSLPLPEDTYFPPLEVYAGLAVSPDGRQVAFLASSQGVRRLWVRQLDQGTSRVLPGTENALSPFWSPDGRFLGYFAQGRMMKIEITGGPPRLIYEGSLEGDAEWGEDGDILFASGSEGIFRVSSEGGVPTRLTRPDPAREIEQFWPRHLPGGTHILYLSFGTDPSGGKTRTLYAGNLATGAAEAIPEVESRAAYDDGHLLYVQDGILLARPFDAATRRFTGEPVPLVERLTHLQGSGVAQFSVAAGTLAYHAGTLLARLVRVSPQGETVELGVPAPFSEIRRSPDGRRLAASLEDPRTGSHDLWIYDAVTGIGSRLTSDPADEQSPVWSPDGQWIYYRSDASGPPDIYVRRADGSGQAKRILNAEWPVSPEDLSPDGKVLLYLEYRRERGGTDLSAMNLADSSVRPFIQTPFAEYSARISPDGRWVAFVSYESGTREIYVSPIGSGVTRHRVSTSGGYAPRWRPNGHELLYATPDAALMSVTIDGATGEPIGSARVLMRRELPKTWGEFEPGVDGESIVAIRQIRDPRDAPFQVLLNWQALTGR